MQSEETGLKILKASITNFKNITFKEVEFNGRSAMFVGPNNVGKSSLIQAICSPVNANFMPLEPIKKGEERAKVELTIGGALHGEQVVYNVACYFSAEHSRGRLVLENEEGAKITGGKGVLQEIIGNISFDIMDFIRLGRTDTGKVSTAGVKQQIELLKTLMSKESIEKLWKLDQEKSKIYAERTEINNGIRYLQGNITNNHFTVEEIELYQEEKTASDVSAKIEDARKKNETFKKCEDYIKFKDITKSEATRDLFDLLDTASIKDTEQAIVKIIEDLIDKKVEQCQSYMDKNPLIDIDSLNKEMDELSKHNQNVLKVKQLQEDEKNLKDRQKESDEITKRLAEIEDEKIKLFASSELPVKGLAFNEEMVTYEGLPLSDDQIPTSRLIGIGVRIGMALNPNLKLLVIKDGSLLDKKTLDFILKVCDKEGYQLLIEMVQPEGTELSIDFIEK
ncbi:MAG: AAA family ATPase [Flavobacteriia bacterium]|jgi:hypothetical protein